MCLSKAQVYGQSKLQINISDRGTDIDAVNNQCLRQVIRDLTQGSDEWLANIRFQKQQSKSSYKLRLFWSISEPSLSKDRPRRRPRPSGAVTRLVYRSVKRVYRGRRRFDDNSIGQRSNGQLAYLMWLLMCRGLVCVFCFSFFLFFMLACRSFFLGNEHCYCLYCLFVFFEIVFSD